MLTLARSPGDARYTSRNWYIYSMPMPNPSLAAGGIFKSVLTTAPDSDFFWQQLILEADVLDDTFVGAPPIPYLTLDFANEKNGRHLMTAPVNAALICGGGAANLAAPNIPVNPFVPFILPEPLWMEPNLTISCAVKNAGGRTQTFYVPFALSLLGVRCFL